MLLKYRRMVKNGIMSFKRSGFVSLSAILVMTITLCVMTSLLFLQAILNNALSDIKNKVDVTIYMNQDAPESEIQSLKKEIENLSEVDSVLYTSAEDAFNRFKSKYENDTTINQVLDILGENPLGAELNIKAKDPSQYESIVNFLDTENMKASGYNQYISKVNYFQNKNIIDKLNTLIKGSEKLGFIITLVLFLISIIITFNTIRLAIYISREEINIMKLVGANDAYIRGPFMVAGAIYGILSALITIVVYLPITRALGSNMTGFLGMDMWNYFSNNKFQILILLFGVGIFLGVVSSFLATRKYLNK